MVSCCADTSQLDEDYPIGMVYVGPNTPGRYMLG